MNSHCIYGAYSLGVEQIMSHRGEPCDRSKSTPGSCQLCPCGSFQPSQENPFPPSAGLFSHLQCSGGLHGAPHRQGAPGKTALFPQPSCTPDPSASVSHPLRLQGPFLLEAGRAVPSFLFLNFSTCSQAFRLLPLLLLGKFSDRARLQ